jgi:cellulase/cellobiase CelA1
LPGKHNTAFPLRRYGFIGGAATLLVVLVSWVAVRAVGPVEPEARFPMMVQPTVPLPVGAAPSPSLVASPSASASPSPSVSRSPSKRPSPKAKTRTTTKPPRKTPSRSPSPSAAFAGSYQLARNWDRGFIGVVTVTNKTGPARGWTVRITFPGKAGVRVGNTWNARVDRQGDTFAFTGGPLAPGATATLGFEASKQVRGQIQPSGCTVDGTSCRMT